MRRKNNLVRRNGYKYILFRNEIHISLLYQKINNFLDFPFIYFKVLIRITPDFILQLAYTFDPNRTNYIEDLKLKKYITVLKKYNL